jgi:hypothetical protein
MSADRSRHRVSHTRRASSSRRKLSPSFERLEGRTVLSLYGPNADISGLQIFPADNAWNMNISAQPVDPRSAQLIADVGLSSPLHPEFGSFTSQRVPIGIPYDVVGAGQPTVTVIYDRNGGQSDPGPFPIPPDAPAENRITPPEPTSKSPTNDQHLIVVDRDNMIEYDLAGAYTTDGGATWHAYAGAKFDLTSDAQRPLGWTSADAAGLPILPGLVRYDVQAAIANGTYNLGHAIRFTAPSTSASFVAPARHYAASGDLSQPPMGMRVRLKADFDVSGFSPEDQVILNTLKTYGMILADNGAPWFITGAPDPRWDNNDLHALTQVAGSDFEVVQMGTIYGPPTIGSLTPSAATLPQGGDLWLTANAIVDNLAQVSKVSFYVDSNHDGVLDAGDALVGVDRYAADGWSAYVPLDGYAAGKYTFFAQAADTFGQVSQPVATSVTVAAATLKGYRFDFGSATSPAAAHYKRVANTTAYTQAQGFGWASGVLHAVDSKAPGTSALTEDGDWFNSSADFRVDLPNGTYQVTVAMVDFSGSYQTALQLDGTSVGTVSGPAGQPMATTYTVTVTSGHLDLGLSNVRGYGALAGLKIVPS